jgi:tetratricopeptide (TPR) repeat protein
VFVASVPNVANWEVIKGLLQGKWEYVDAGILDATHLRFFTLESCRDLFAKAGFEPSQVQAVNGPQLPETAALATLLSQLRLVNEDFVARSRAIQYLFVASKKVATKPQRLSLCVVVGDDEEYLSKCLSSAQPWVEEIVVVDTGSSDQTVAIAHSFGAKVIDFAWTGDFAAARDCAIEAATGDWILVLDADEEIVQSDGPELRKLLQRSGTAGWYVSQVSFIGDDPRQDAVCDVALRVLRNDPDDRLLKRGEVGHSNVRINRYGYFHNQVSVKRSEVDREVELLRAELADQSADPLIHLNLGAQLMRRARYKEALGHHQEAFKHRSTLDTGCAAILVRNIVVCLIKLNCPEEALKVLEDALAAFPDYGDLPYLRGRVYLEMREYTKARESFHQCLRPGRPSRQVSQVGVDSDKAWHGIGDCLAKLGDDREAVRAYTQALHENGQFPASLVSLGAMLLDHEDAQEVLVFLGRLVDTSDVDALALLAQVFTSKGRHEEALALLERARDIEPQQRFSLLIGEALLNLKRYDEALAALDRVPQHSRYHVPAASSQLFCHIVRGRLPEASAVLEAAGDDSLYGHLLAVDRALVSLLKGGVPTPPGEGDRTPRERIEGTVWDLLQKLLQAETFELFEKALGLLPWAGVRPEVQALRLGKLYHRLGYEDSAIEQLGAALDLGSSDAEALGILGDLSRARDLHEEAVSFYQEALKLDAGRLTLYSGLVSSLSSLRRYEEAVGVLQNGLKHLPSSPPLVELLEGMDRLAGAAVQHQPEAVEAT